MLRLPDNKQILRVAIDGVDGAGKTIFAEELASILTPFGRPIVRASLDGFHNPQEIRYARGRDSPQGFYLDSYDYVALRRRLLEPLGPGGTRIYSTAIFDCEINSPLISTECVAEDHSILIFDGIFLQRPELRPYWDLCVFLSVPFEVSIPRGASRGPGYGSSDPADPSNRRYIEGQQLYFANDKPYERADIVINNTDLTSPIIIRDHDR